MRAEARQLARAIHVRLARQGSNGVVPRGAARRRDGRSAGEDAAHRTRNDYRHLGRRGRFLRYGWRGAKRKPAAAPLTADRIRGNVVVRTAGGDITFGARGRQCKMHHGRRQDHRQPGARRTPPSRPAAAISPRRKCAGWCAPLPWREAFVIHNAGSAVIATTGGGSDRRGPGAWHCHGPQLGRTGEGRLGRRRALRKRRRRRESR